MTTFSRSNQTTPNIAALKVVKDLFHVLKTGGEWPAATMTAKLGAKADSLAYNGFVQSWPEIARLVREGSKTHTEHVGLFDDTEE